MTDLLTPEEVRDWGYHREPDDDRTPEDRLLHRLCRDYLTLWDRLTALMATYNEMEKEYRAYVEAKDD